MNEEKKKELIKAAEQYLLEKYGVAFLRMDKEKQGALICETIINAINTHGARSV